MRDSILALVAAIGVVIPLAYVFILIALQEKKRLTVEEDDDDNNDK